MPFGLKSAEATYQRLVNQMFEKQIGRNVEVYVDDMLVKSNSTAGHKLLTFMDVFSGYNQIQMAEED